MVHFFLSSYFFVFSTFVNNRRKFGFQIFDDYGVYFATSPKIERDAKFEYYHFKCECPACKNNWPLYEVLPNFDVSSFCCYYSLMVCI